MRKGAKLNLPNSLTILRIFLVPILVVILLLSVVLDFWWKRSAGAGAAKTASV